MDFRLTEEQRLVRDTARDFVDRELIPHARDWEEKGEVPRSFYRKMASLGFLGAPVPEKYGGAGMASSSCRKRRPSTRELTSRRRRNSGCARAPPRNSPSRIAAFRRRTWSARRATAGIRRCGR